MYSYLLAGFKKLKMLNLESCDKISKQFYQDFLPHLTQINCRELTLTSCPVTDDGIRGLCVAGDDMGRPSDRLGLCKSIPKLNISFTKVTERAFARPWKTCPS